MHACIPVLTIRFTLFIRCCTDNDHHYISDVEVTGYMKKGKYYVSDYKAIVTASYDACITKARVGIPTVNCSFEG